ncbi:ferritin family protein [Anaerobaca lacustris]|uniref:Ferritin family protein n=1 Tax=Anaerobaca lacustris TaxID=3044600 RepID=A0AAW6U618_9BACT|nr:ferritin family protein [Sedimentisphaerales bacterium M17dextr]
MGERFESVGAALDFAIGNEVEAHAFYRELAARTDVAAMRRVFEEFAAEELGHKAKLEAVQRGSRSVGAMNERVQSLGLADYLVESPPQAQMTYAEALILAMKKEKAAYRLYLDLAAAVDAGELAELFRSLAAEEARHKLRFEIEYDDVVLKEN